MGVVDVKLSVETLIRIYNDKTGDFLQVGPDPDGLDLVEVASFCYGIGSPAVKQNFVIMQKEEAIALAHSILKLYEVPPEAAT